MLRKPPEVFEACRAEASFAGDDARLRFTPARQPSPVTA
jgi:hypothetical protein